MATFREGQRVILKADPAEGLPEERGVFLGYEPQASAEVQARRARVLEEMGVKPLSEKAGVRMCVVRVDEQFRAPGDDGLRETACDQLAHEGTFRFSARRPTAGDRERDRRGNEGGA